MTIHDETRGLLAPLRRDGKKDLAAGSGPELWDAKVRQVLLTDGDTPQSAGELPWRTSFGAGLSRLRHQRNTAALAELARVYVRDALRRWLPSVVLVDVAVVQRDAELAVEITYRTSRDSAPQRVVISQR
jgi:uncharacterized protein